jgi:hypothetical protein
VLAVLVASPCTAPFMGAALGFALTQPAATSLAVFGAGLGMALPYMPLTVRARLAPLAAAPRGVDAAAEAGAGLPDVRHRGVAGVGAGPADRHRRAGARAADAGGAGVLLWLAHIRGAAACSARARPALALAALLAWGWPGVASAARRARRRAAADARPPASDGRWQPYDEALLARWPPTAAPCSSTSLPRGA